MIKTNDNKEQEEKRYKQHKERVMKGIKKIDRYLRELTINSFEKVYTSLALQKIAEDLALQYSLGEIEVVKSGDVLEISILNPNMTTTDIKNLINRESHNTQIYTIVEALREVDYFKVENNPKGPGIVFKVYKTLKSKINLN